MLSGKQFLKEEAYIGEELLKPESDLERTCLVVKQAVQDGDFSLAEALKLYGISQDDYEKFIAKNAVQEIQISLTGITATLKMAATVDVMAKMVQAMFGNADAKSSPVIKQLETLSKEIKKTRISA